MLKLLGDMEKKMYVPELLERKKEIRKAFNDAVTPRFQLCEQTNPRSKKSIQHKLRDLK